MSSRRSKLGRYIGTDMSINSMVGKKKQQKMRIMKTDRVRVNNGVRGWNMRKNMSNSGKSRDVQKQCISLSLPPILNLHCLCKIFLEKIKDKN